MTAKAKEVPVDFTKSRSQMLIIEGVRLGFLLAILAITLGFQALQPEFVNIEVLFPTFMLMASAFALNAVYLLFFESALKLWLPTAILFFFEAVFITGLIHVTGVNQSIFLFLYLVNIILCGFVFQRRGAMVLALWTSVLFSFLIILGPELKGQALFFAVGLNNIAFFAVAALSGFLSEQINFMGSALAAQGKDLKALKNLNSLIVDNIGSGLMTIDADGRILQANRAALDILDPIPREIIGKPIDGVVPDLREKLNAVVPVKSNEEERDGAETTPVSSRFDLHYQTPTGEKLVLELAVSALPSENSLTGHILTFQDLTRVRRLESQMRQSEKMAAVGQLAAGIAHEIRNPLASISGSIQLLGSSFTARQEEEQRLMAISLREIDRLNNLITEFLDFVRPDALKDDPVDLNTLIREITEMLKFNKTLRAEVKQALTLDASYLISGHRDKLKQAFLNIIINAYQAMNDAADPVVTISTINGDGKVIVKIRDRGVGIDEVGLRKIFEPFHTTKPKGTGLGLAVTHKIIESHNGRIFVESTKGVGTEFTLEFPARESSGGLDQNALADSQRASENFSIAFRGQKRGNG
jgi:two-component system, NtrC family, sensor histidine kinase PilS